MLKTLAMGAHFFKFQSLTVKSHPNNLIKVENYPKLNLLTTNQPLNKLLSNYDVVIASIYTSAGLEAYCLGLRVLTFLDKNDFNFSPLRNQSGISYFSNIDQFMEVMNSKNIANPRINNYFHLDNELPRWKKLIEKYY